ncbi:MAG: sulfurtransferase [Actinomycetia bacterium]|nr:sulfurtransferase [Actinomycetes bacterium]MCH9767451.1 sulfurtransferase [Actinomycetes bacterium]
MSSREDVFITAEDLAGRLESGEPITLLDVRWDFSRPDGLDAYERGHLPGAVYVSLDDELTDHSVPGRGRHPLPSGADLQEAARRWGVRTGVPVVVYDDWYRAGSARAWWVLTAAGITDVRILDGGLSSWRGELSTGTVTPERGDVSVAHADLYSAARRTVTADGVLADDRVLLDTRPPERYRGDAEPADPVAGHIPGAVNVPSTSLLAGDGSWLAEPELTQLLHARGVGSGDVAVYCGSGVTAAVVIAGLAAVGVDAALFPGSWSEWSSDPERPVALGPG